MKSNLDVAELRKSKPREFDAMVAEKVMGLEVLGEALVMRIEGESVLSGKEPWHGKPGDGYHSIQPVYFRGPDQWRTIEPDEKKQECLGVHTCGLSVVPRYSTETAHDYAVLKFVRETWYRADKEAFIADLCSVLRIRQNMEFSTQGTMWLVFFGAIGDEGGIKTGDYAHAALLVALAKEVQQ